MPNCIIKGIQDKLWIEYENYDGELQINAVYLDQDRLKTDIYDYLSESVLEKADTSMREDFAELQAEIAFERSKRYKRFYAESEVY